MTTCRREGDAWILNGQKKWIGNATSPTSMSSGRATKAPAKSRASSSRRRTPGFSVEKIKTKMALRVVQNGLITLKDCRVPEADRLQNANTFQGLRQGLADDPDGRRMVRCRLRDGRLRARVSLRART